MYSMSRATRVYSTVHKTAQPAPWREKYTRYDWAAMLEKAQVGELPDPLEMHDKSRRMLLADIINAAEAGNIAKLQGMTIGSYNSSVKMLSKYRDICVVALQARAVPTWPSTESLDIRA